MNLWQGLYEHGKEDVNPADPLIKVVFKWTIIMIEITPYIKIDEKELVEDFIRSSGPGGQKVNKVATAVQLKFDVVNSPSLSDHAGLRRRLIRLAGNKITKDGVLIIKADRFRTQDMNRKDAIDRLIGLVKRASLKPRPRIKTKPSRASKQKRLDMKKQRGKIKKNRQDFSLNLER